LGDTVVSSFGCYVITMKRHMMQHAPAVKVHFQEKYLMIHTISKKFLMILMWMHAHIVSYTHTLVG
jgi:hypothetical protein